MIGLVFHLFRRFIPYSSSLAWLRVDRRDDSPHSLQFIVFSRSANTPAGGAFIVRNGKYACEPDAKCSPALLIGELGKMCGKNRTNANDPLPNMLRATHCVMVFTSNAYCVPFATQRLRFVVRHGHLLCPKYWGWFSLLCSFVVA